MTEPKIVSLNGLLQKSNLHHASLAFMYPTVHGTYRVYVEDASPALTELLNMMSMWGGADHTVPSSNNKNLDIPGWEMNFSNANVLMQLSYRYHGRSLEDCRQAVVRWVA